MLNIINEKHNSYASQANAVKALEKACEKCNLQRLPRYVIAVNAEGRFVPVVLVGASLGEFVQLAHNGITITG